MKSLDELCELGMLEPAEVHVARALLRLGGEHDPAVELGAALAARAPRLGHVCVELDSATERLAQFRDDLAMGKSAVEGWPAPEAWLACLAASPLVHAVGPGEADDHCVDRPLVLDGARLYLERYWRYQQRVVGHLRRRALERPEGVDLELLRAGLDRLFVDDGQHPTPVDRQRLAGTIASLRRFAVVSGGPGTGKTTTVKKILALLLEQRAALPGARPLRIALAAPTGKAAARLQDSIRDELGRLEVDEGIREQLAGITSLTIHRLLGVRPDQPSRFRHGVDRPLLHDVVVVDEASMVSLPLMAKLLDAVGPSARLILLGDQDQLASVEAGAVLGDICNPGRERPRYSRAFAAEVAQVAGLELADPAAGIELVEAPGIGDCIVQLDRFYRFGQDSGIGGVARAIQRAPDGEASADAIAYLRGERTEQDSRGHYRDVALLEGHSTAPVLEAALAGYGPLVRAALEGRPSAQVLEALGRVAVLCPHRRGELGVEGLNTAIERHLARQIPGLRLDERWYVGRPVMVVQNDHTLRLYNGDVGVVVLDPDGPQDPDRADGPEPPARRVVAFPGAAEGEVRHVAVARLPPCETVFAMSIHKSQGSQFGHAVVVLPARRSPIMTRELIYTAITRARQRVTVVGSGAVLEDALARRVTRPSGLRPKLWPA